jgi:tetratricopeptide (TPR) repeat protein
VHAHIARIRRLLRASGGDGALAGASGGYRLDVDPDEVDLHRYRRLTAQARDHQHSRKLLDEAMACWRGTPLAGIPGRWAAEAREGWSRRHLDTVIAWSDVADAGPAVDALTVLVEENPLVEPLAGALMRALHRAGRTAEALDCYLRTRKSLVDELGIEPGAELADLHRTILAGAAGPEPARPAQLPPDIPAFVGRRAELERLDTVAGQPLIVISGTAGVGKTALATHWATSVADRFPDGVLHVNLRGYDPSGATTPAEAVRGFLEAFDVPSPSIPVTQAAQVGLYRRLVAGKRVLVLLDNARDADHVRPLLPNSAGCLAVVTSRHLLPALVVTDGAFPLDLDLLSVDESRQLLAARLGADRVAEDQGSVDEIIGHCARLPLAMTLVATRATMHRRFALAGLVDKLRAAEGRLDALSSVDRSIDVRTVFSWSYGSLSGAAAELFRMFGVHCGPEITAPAAAALLGVDVRRVDVLLAELADAHLIVEQAEGRFGLHDLLRAYAVELLEEDPAEALRRVLDYYLHSAYAADGLLYPYRDEIDLEPPRDGVTPQAFGTDRQAAAWLAAERPVLLAAVAQAAAAGFPAHAYRLALTLVTFLDRRGYWDDMITALHLALEVARRLGDPALQGEALRRLGTGEARLGRHDRAAELARDALDVYVASGNRIGEARTHRDLAMLYWRRGQRPEALHHIREVLQVSVTAGLRAGPAFALYLFACVHFLTGDYPRAVEVCRAAVAAYRQIGDRVGAAVAWEGCGLSYAEMGEFESALTCYQEALTLRRGTDERFLVADSLALIGDTHAAAGRPAEARESWLAAHEILGELGHPDAGALAAKLS